MCVSECVCVYVSVLVRKGTLRERIQRNSSIEPANAREKRGGRIQGGRDKNKCDRRNITGEGRNQRGEAKTKGQTTIIWGKTRQEGSKKGKRLKGGGRVASVTCSEGNMPPRTMS